MVLGVVAGKFSPKPPPQGKLGTLTAGETLSEGLGLAHAGVHVPQWLNFQPAEEQLS